MAAQVAFETMLMGGTLVCRKRRCPMLQLHETKLNGANHTQSGQCEGRVAKVIKIRWYCLTAVVHLPRTLIHGTLQYGLLYD